MMRLVIAVAVAVAVFVLAACSGPSVLKQNDDRGTTASSQIVLGYAGGCEEGFTIYSQNQFKPFGAMVRPALDRPGVGARLLGNDPLTAFGWVETELLFYPGNPEGLRGRVWFYVKLPNGRFGWVPDAGVRAVMTDPAPGDDDKYFIPGKHAAPQSASCKLTLR